MTTGGFPISETLRCLYIYRDIWDILYYACVFFTFVRLNIDLRYIPDTPFFPTGYPHPPMLGQTIGQIARSSQLLPGSIPQAYPLKHIIHM